MTRLLLISAAILLAGGLAPLGCSIISKDVLKEVDRSATLILAQANPPAFTGKKILWGGVILKTDNLENTTEIEVLESELSYGDTSEDGRSRGRFIIEAKGFLDPNVYKPSKRITVAGAIKGASTRKIGKMDYAYPVIAPIEMKVYEYVPQPDYPLPWWYDPYYPGPYYPYGPYGPYPGPYPYNPYRYQYPYNYPYAAPPPAGN